MARKIKVRAALVVDLETGRYGVAGCSERNDEIATATAHDEADFPDIDKVFILTAEVELPDTAVPEVAADVEAHDG